LAIEDVLEIHVTAAGIQSSFPGKPTEGTQSKTVGHIKHCSPRRWLICLVRTENDFPQQRM